MKAVCLIPLILYLIGAGILTYFAFTKPIGINELDLAQEKTAKVPAVTFYWPLIGEKRHTSIATQTIVVQPTSEKLLKNGYDAMSIDSVAHLPDTTSPNTTIESLTRERTAGVSTNVYSFSLNSTTQSTDSTTGLNGFYFTINDVPESNNTYYLVGTGIDRFPFMASNLKRRIPKPIRAEKKFDPFKPENDDMLEYVSRQFAVYSFQDMSAIETCLWADNFSFPLKQTIGGVLNTHPILCGGLTRTNKPISKCFQYSNHTWNVFADLNNPLQTHRGITINNVLFIQNRALLLALYSNSSFHIEIALPIKFSHSCLINLNQSQIGIIGGVNDQGYLGIFLIYDIDTKTLKIGPNILQPRSNHACSTFMDDKGVSAIIVAGGFVSNKKLKTTEILRSGQSKFTPGPTLPRASQDFSLIVLKDLRGFVMIGGLGSAGALYWLKLGESTWEHVKPLMKPSIIQASPIVLPISQDLVETDKCKKVDDSEMWKVAYDSYKNAFGFMASQKRYRLAQYFSQGDIEKFNQIREDVLQSAQEVYELIHSFGIINDWVLNPELEYFYRIPKTSLTQFLAPLNYEDRVEAYVNTN